MEIVIVVAIWTVMVKRGVEDILHTARGGTPHRYTAARKQGSSGAWGRYWRTLSDDTAADLLKRHNDRRDRRASGSPRPRGAAATFFANRWRAAWERADEKRANPSKRTVRSRLDRRVMPIRFLSWRLHNWFKRKAEPVVNWWDEKPCPGQETVPGEVVPNAEDGGRDEQRDRPQDETEDRPRPEPAPVPEEDEDETGDQDEDQQDDEPPSCPKCGTDMTTAPNIGDPMSYDGKGIYRCPRCDYKIRRSPETTDDFTQEGPTTMTATTTEVVGLDSAIRFCEDSARAYRAQIQAIEQTQAALAAGEVTGPAAETFSQAMEQSSQAAASMDAAAAELLRHKQVQEAYLANQGAGNRDFILAGQ